MDYPLRDFLRHMEMWRQVRELKIIEPIPEQGKMNLPVGSSMSERIVHLRIMHMLSADGCTPEQRKYRGQRFFAMNQFISLHGETFRKAGFIVFDDGEKGTVPSEITRAVHDTFKGEPLLDAYDQPVDAVIAKAKMFQG